MTTSETEIAWAAGFFDGEGCISGQWRGHNYYPKLFLAQRSDEALKRFMTALGLDLKISQTTKRKSNYYYIQISRLPVILEVFEKMGPYLCNRKKADLQSVIEEIEACDYL